MLSSMHSEAASSGAINPAVYCISDSTVIVRGHLAEAGFQFIRCIFNDKTMRSPLQKILVVVIIAELSWNQSSDASWSTWRALLAGFYGLPLDEQELMLLQRITALPKPAQEPLLEFWLAAGRGGGGESQIAAFVAVYKAAFRGLTNRRHGAFA